MRAEPLLTCPPVRLRRESSDRLREALLDLAGGEATILAHSETAWASVTFAGARHRLVLAFEGASAIDAGETFIAWLPEHEFDLPSQLVADAAVTEVDHRLQPERLQVTCELLLLEEG
jgi:hypothetical protein